MRRKLPISEKRSCIIGIKVKPETRKKIKYMADREGDTMSTYLEKLIEQEITRNIKAAHISENEILGGENNGN